MSNVLTNESFDFEGNSYALTFFIPMVIGLLAARLSKRCVDNLAELKVSFQH